MTSHVGLIKGGELTLQIENEFNYNPRKFDLIISTNQTIFDLKQMIGLKIEKFWEQIAI